jgi:hypothetical protein
MREKSKRTGAGRLSSTPTVKPRMLTARTAKPVARWLERDGHRRLQISNSFFQVELWPDLGGAISAYVDLSTGFDIIWKNPYGQPPRVRPLEQPMSGGSDLYDVMDGSWYVSLPNGFFAGDYFGAPLGTHGELRSLPWRVEKQTTQRESLSVTLVGRSVRTPLIYRRELTIRRDSPFLHWRETLENRSGSDLPVAWLQHPTFGGPLIEGARLIVPAKSVSVFRADDPTTLQLQAGFKGEWPFVPQRVGGQLRDCSIVADAGSGKDHSVQLTEFEQGWGCIWNERHHRGFAMEWELDKFPYAWSWNSGGGVSRYPLWGEGHLITLQPSTSPVGRFSDLLKRGELLNIPAHGAVSTVMRTGFVGQSHGPWKNKRP